MFTPEQKQFIRFVSEICLCGAIVSALIALVVILSVNPESYASGLKHKIARLDSAPNPRIIFVGGSGVGIGIDSDKIRKETGYHPTNMGVFAAVGVHFMFESIDSKLREGDVVVFIPDHEMLQQPWYGDGNYLFQTIHANPSLLFYVSPRVAPAMFRHFPGWLQFKIKSIYVRHVEKYFIGREPAFSDIIYNVYNFNEYGDVISEVAGDRHLSTEEVLNSFSGYVGVSTNPKTIALLKNKTSELEERGVRVFFSWNAMAESIYNTQPDKVRSRVEEIQDAVGADRVLGSIEDFIVPDDYFLDSSTHTTHLGRDEYTKRLIPLLTRILRSE